MDEAKILEEAKNINLSTIQQVIKRVRFSDLVSPQMTANWVQRVLDALIFTFGLSILCKVSGISAVYQIRFKTLLIFVDFFF